MKAKLEQRQALAGARSTAHWHGFQIRAPCSSARSVAGRAVAAPDAPSTSQRLPLPPPDRNQRIREGGSEAALVQAQVRPLGRNHGAGIRRGGAPCAARRCADGRCPLLSRTPLAPRPHAPAPPPRSPVLQARRRPGLARVAAGGAAARRERRRGRRRLRPGGSLPRSAAGAARPQRRPRGCVADFKRSCRRSACMQQCSRACGRVQHAALQHAAGRPHTGCGRRASTLPCTTQRMPCCPHASRPPPRAGPDTPFVNNYGVWVDEFKSLGLGDTLELSFPDATCWFGEGNEVRQHAWRMRARCMHAFACMRSHGPACARMRVHVLAGACMRAHAVRACLAVLACGRMRPHGPAWARMGLHSTACATCTGKLQCSRHFRCSPPRSRPPQKRVGRAYGRVSRRKLRQHLAGMCAAAGVRYMADEVRAAGVLFGY